MRLLPFGLSAMFTNASSDAFQPPRKEKSKGGLNNSTDVLVLEDSDSVAIRARGAGKNRRKTKPTSIAHCCHGFVATIGNRPLRLLKGVGDAIRGCLCPSPAFTGDADAFLDSLPLPKKSEPMAKLWPSIDAPALQE